MVVKQHFKDIHNWIWCKINHVMLATFSIKWVDFFTSGMYMFLCKDEKIVPEGKQGRCGVMKNKRWSTIWTGFFLKISKCYTLRKTNEPKSITAVIRKPLSKGVELLGRYKTLWNCRIMIPICFYPFKISRNYSNSGFLATEIENRSWCPAASTLKIWFCIASTYTHSGILQNHSATIPIKAHIQTSEAQLWNIECLHVLHYLHPYTKAPHQLWQLKFPIAIKLIVMTHHRPLVHLLRNTRIYLPSSSKEGDSLPFSQAADRVNYLILFR